MRVVVALLALLAGIVPLTASAQSQPPGAASRPIAPLPIEALSAPANLTMPVISPDGSKIAARITNAGRTWIAIYDLAGPPDQMPQVHEEREFTINWLRWANAEQLLVGIEVVQSVYSIEIPVTRLIMLNVRTRSFRVLDTGNGLIGDRVLHVDPAGRSILVAADSLALDPPRVIRVDLATGQSTTVQRPRIGVWNWFVDGAGVVRAGVEYAENRTRLHYRPTADAELRTITLARGEDGGIVDDIGFATSGENGVMLTDSVTGRFAAYAFDFATGTRGPVIFEHPTADVTSLVGANGQLAAVTYEDERPRTHWVQPELRAIQEAIDRALPGKTNIIINRSDGSAKVLLWSGAADDPGSYYVFDRAARRIEAFAAPYDALLGRQFAAVRPVSYRSRDGLTIPGYLTLPPGRPERGLPLVLMPHGGPFARDSWEFNPEVQLLASRGYAVLQPNFRGSTGYGRAHVEQGYGQFGTGMINDMEDGVAWLVEQGIVDPARVCIMGSSYGGYAAMWAATRAERPYRCAISFAGVSDLGSMLRYNRRQFIPRRYMRDWQQRVRGEERMDLSTISPLEHAERLRVPILIAHGSRDLTVPPSQSANIVRALTRARANVESKVYPEAAHGFSRPEDAADYYRRVEAFLAAHNPADPPPAAAASAAAPGQ